MGSSQTFTAETSYEGKGKKMRDFKKDAVENLDDPNLMSKHRDLVCETTAGGHDKT